MSARAYHHLTNDQKDAVRAAFAQTHLGAPYTKRVVESFRAAGVPIRQPDEAGKYYPSFFPWLKVAKSKITSTSTSKITSTSTKRILAPTPTPTLPLSPPERVNAAVQSVASALVEFVLAEVTESLQQTAISLKPAKLAAAAVPAERRPLTAESSSSSLHSLSDQQLKDRLGVAKAANNIGLCAKITNVLRMRDRSATVIANTHQEEM
jgi:hypothetical protein